jgi:phosphoribosylamine--glycine ligase/phosphoribosylformylglycinamidine cyclo-ligase
MKVLVIGSGGREHCLAWKLAQSSRVERVYVAPGNGGTAWDGVAGQMAPAQNVALGGDDIEGLVAWARDARIDLTVVGPEAPLVAGVVDAFTAAGLRAFGPSKEAAQLEGSKAFAKRFMWACDIPTGQARIFDRYDAALAYLRQAGAPIVVKASGLAAGKGVTVCDTLPQAEEALRAAMVDRVFGAAGAEVLIEERLSGQEASLLAFCDGRTVVPMVSAQDHKAAYDGDRGPNTGGMGCYAPAPLMTPKLVARVVREVLQPAVDGMHERGTPYTGVLYAGLMIAGGDPQVLEFNCRFGDPETQVILPLLETDLIEVIEACLDRRLAGSEVAWRKGYATCVVMASGGYPLQYEKGKAIAGLDEAERQPGVVVYHAGTRREGERVLTTGGRVLGVTAVAPTLQASIDAAYAGVARIHFEQAHYRTDIGAKGVANAAASPAAAHAAAHAVAQAAAYAAAGVDIDRKMGAIARMKQVAQRSYGPAVLAGIGNFGGLFDAGALKQAGAPVLVASTDGVGTKTKIAAAMGAYRGLGHDIVNHCINDILVQGARPLFFLDYIAASRLDPEMLVELVTGCAEACAEVGCALLGGETAEMPGVYAGDEFDLVGTIVGWLDKSALIDGRDVRPGDLCLGLPSSGLHTNGYSLARKVLADVPWDADVDELGMTLGKSLLAVHRSYLKPVEKLWNLGITIKAMAHITGGGFPDNLPRVIPSACGVALDRSAWEPLPVFRLIQERGGIDPLEMYRVFNMGMGMVLVLDPADVDVAIRALQDTFPEGPPAVIGRVTAWDGSGAQVRL